jgi:hypothetical protein
MEIIQVSVELNDKLLFAFLFSVSYISCKLSMKRKIILTASVLAIISYFLVNTWITILNENYLVKWHHLTSLIFFLPLPILLFKNYKAAVLGTGIYLILGICRLVSLTAGISTSSITIAGLETPGFNWLCLGLFVLFFILHLDILIDMQLDYKERKAKLKDTNLHN